VKTGRTVIEVAARAVTGAATIREVLGEMAGAATVVVGPSEVTPVRRRLTVRPRSRDPALVRFHHRVNQRQRSRLATSLDRVCSRKHVHFPSSPWHLKRPRQKSTTLTSRFKSPR
jgi:hypothetical protein